MESTKRRRVRSSSPVYDLDEQNDSYELYVPIAKRRQEKMAKLSSWGINAGKAKTKRQQEEADEREDSLKEEELRRERARKERTLLIEAQEVHLQKAAQGLLRLCMLMAHSLYITPSDSKKTAGEKAQEADAEILEAIKSRRKLASDMELAKGIQYTESLKSRCTSWFTIVSSLILYKSWLPPQYILERTAEQNQKLRNKYHIIVEGDNIPAPIEHFVVSVENSVASIWLTLFSGHENSGTYIGIFTVKSHR